MSKLLRLGLRNRGLHKIFHARLKTTNIRPLSSFLFGHNFGKSKKINDTRIYFPIHRVRQFSETTIKVPNMGDSISEGTLVEWVKNVGDSCNQDDIVAIIETDKVSIDIRTDYAGELTEQLAKVDDTLEVGAPLFKIDTSKTGSSSKPESAKKEPQKQEEKQTESSKEQQQPPPPPKTEEKKSSSPPPPPLPPQKGTRNETVVAMSRMRQKIASRLKDAQNTAASLTTFNEIDMSNIISFRNKYKEEFEKIHGIKLGFMSIFVTAATRALQKYPAVNAYISESGKEIIYHDYCDVSVAVASPNGLVVPVIRNTESMSFADIEKSIGDYAAKAKNGSLSLDEMAGGTFTISNGGVFGSLMGTPILNPPQSAILGMHGTFQRPIAQNGEVKIKPMMYVALTYDHRIIDGREAVLFLRTVKDNVEDPTRLVFDI